jgi:hypothetical protein
MRLKYNIWQHNVNSAFQESSINNVNNIHTYVYRFEVRILFFFCCKIWTGRCFKLFKWTEAGYEVPLTCIVPLFRNLLDWDTVEINRLDIYSMYMYVFMYMCMYMYMFTYICICLRIYVYVYYTKFQRWY